MTEGEAKTRWCPHRTERVSISEFPDVRPNRTANCIAPGCMMWKWENSSKRDGYGNTRVPTGYCGLTEV